MAGLYAMTENADRVRLEHVASWMRYGAEKEVSLIGPFSYVWLGYDRENLFSPAHDDRTGVHVVTAGRVCWPKSELQRAERLPFRGGVANRLLLDTFLRSGPQAITPYNGAAAIIVWDPRSQHVHLWTDQFGYHPAFLYGTDAEAPTVFTTFPDAIRCDPALDSCCDEVSMAEFLRAWRTTPPHTYYKYLKHAGAATHWQWHLSSGKVEHSSYWKPFEKEFYRSLPEASEALAAAASTAVRERTEIVEKAVFFVSGGSDSRVMLYAADDPQKICGINIYEDRPTNESLIAKSLCERIGVEYIGVGRDNDYYPRMLSENVRWSGAMWSTEDTHYLGMRDLVMEQCPELVMTACTTDWLFKGYGLEKTYKQFLGKYLPVKQFLPNRIDGFLPNYPRAAPSLFADAISDRLAAWFAGCPTDLKTDCDYLAVEDRRIRPACYTVSVSGQIMYRVFPYDTFLADSRIADCYARTPARWKLNGEVWGQAAGIICSRASDIVDANFGWRVNASPLAKLTRFAHGWAKRKLSRVVTVASPKVSDHPPTYASWPDYGWYAIHSPTLQKLWTQTSSTDRERVTAMWGSDPWSESLEQWSKKPLDMFRIITLLQYWRKISQPNNHLCGTSTR